MPPAGTGGDAPSGLGHLLLAPPPRPPSSGTKRKANDTVSVSSSTIPSEGSSVVGGSGTHTQGQQQELGQGQGQQNLVAVDVDWMAAARKYKKKVPSFVIDLQLIEAMKQEEKDNDESENESDPDVMEDKL